MQFPDIAPVALAIGPLVIRWYALAYVAGILLGQYYVLWLDRRGSGLVPPPLGGRLEGGRGMPETSPHPGPTLTLPLQGREYRAPILNGKARDDLILYAVIGIILGGRIGYVLFYNLAYYLDNPADIAQIWHGGMSFHGGLCGVLIAFYFFAKRFKISWLQLMDLFAAAAPIGLFFGRLGNFVNGELYGRITTAPWGMVFPHGGPEPRHPSQLYEAGLEGITLFIILWLLATKTRALHYRGMLGGAFIGGYGICRFIVEFFREPDAQLGYLTFGLSMGQWLCVPMMLLGAWSVASAKKRPVT